MKQAFTRTMARYATAAALAAVLASPLVFAAEVYKWTDENGVVHFSDSPHPKAETIEVEEIYRPGSSDAYDSGEADTSGQPTAEQQDKSSADSARAAAPSPEAVEAAEETAEIEKTPGQRRRDELAEARQQAAEEEAKNQRLCQQYRQQLAEVEPSRRVFTTNEEGETERLDDDERLRLVEEARNFLDQNCR